MNLNHALGQAEWPRRGAWRRQRPNLRDGHIVLAHDNGLTTPELFQILRQSLLELLHVNLNHGSASFLKRHPSRGPLDPGILDTAPERMPLKILSRVQQP